MKTNLKTNYNGFDCVCGDVIKDTLFVDIFKHKTQNCLCTIFTALIIYLFLLSYSVF